MLQITKDYATIETFSRDLASLRKRKKGKGTCLVCTQGAVTITRIWVLFAVKVVWLRTAFWSCL